MRIKLFGSFICYWILIQIANGQSPGGFSFQGLLKDSLGGIAKSTFAKVKCQILKGSSTGDLVYEELHSIKTNADGIFSIIIGQGEKMGGPVNSLLAIDWGNDAYYLSIKTAITPSQSIRPNNGSLVYTDVGSTQLWSVPYALYAAQTNPNSIQSASILSENQDLLLLNGGTYIKNAILGNTDLTLSIKPGNKNNVLFTDSSGNIKWASLKGAGMVSGIVHSIELGVGTISDSIIPGNTIISIKIKIPEAKVGEPVFVTGMDDHAGFGVYNALITSKGELTIRFCNYQESPAVLIGKKFSILLMK